MKRSASQFNLISFCCPMSDERFSLGSKVKVKLTLSEIGFFQYGDVSDLTCQLELLLPNGDYPISNFYSLNRSQQEEILDDFVHRLRSLHEDLSDDEIRIKFLGWLVITATVFSTLDVFSTTFRGVLNICAGSFQIDDVLDEMPDNLGIDFSSSSIYKKYFIWEKIFTGEFEAWDQIALAHPIMATAIKFYIEAFHLFCTNCTNFRQNIIPFQRAVFRGSEGLSLMYENRIGFDTFSELAMKTIREADAGGQLFLEASAAISSINLPTFIRQSLIFKIFLSSYNACTGLLNDIFGLKTDLAKNSIQLNSILRRAKGQGLTLQESFSETAMLLKRTTNDLRVSGKMLVNTFVENKSVAEFVSISQRTFDGQIYAYVMLSQLGNTSRYGEITVQILYEN